ncbi:MAG: drug/metabolite exporter YedA [Thermovirgaceae bacterium]|nr:drug/metabolite exporter YedA [Thermovirgaceae bacterium]
MGRNEGTMKPRILFAMAVIYAVWGSTFLANRFSLESFPPFLLNAVRFLSAGVFLYIFLRIRGEERMSLRGWLQSFLVGGLLFVGGSGLLCVGQQWVASGLAATLIATVPLWTVLFAGIWERLPSPMEWAGLVLGIAGVAILNLEKGISGNPMGAVVIIGAAVTWGLGSVVNNRFKELGKPIASATEMIAGGLLLLVASYFAGERLSWPITPRAAIGMFHLVVFASIIGFTLYRFLLREVRPALATSYALANPVTATVLGTLFAGEALSTIALASMAVILAGVTLVFRARSF